jgi:hypothetical protein
MCMQEMELTRLELSDKYQELLDAKLERQRNTEETKKKMELYEKEKRKACVGSFAEGIHEVSADSERQETCM